jgi:alginate O-acetyltransferase complex protein AlgI
LLRGKKSLRLWLLLIASYFFYAWWDYRFIALIAFVSIVNWTAGKRLHYSNSQAERGRILSIALILSLCPLLFFKYLPWLGSYAEVFLGDVARNWYSAALSSIILPVGISFFTFQALSYTIDLYNSQCEFCPSLLQFAAYVSMFPQLLAGPIIRFKDIDAQLRSIDCLDRDVDFISGLELFSRGLIKKVFFADWINVLIGPTFAAGADINTLLAWVSILGYALQIYFDFSGYSDMAIGVGRCMGFRFPNNFNAPYTSPNPAEFWRRWHISFSRWILGYIFMPLQLRFRDWKIWGTILALLITFLVSGIWHGAAWTFVFWGLWHGIMLSLHRVAPAVVRQRIPGWLAVLMLNFGVLIGWVFFRIPSMKQAFSFLAVMAGIGPAKAIVVPWQMYFLVPFGYLLHYLERKDLDAPFVRKKVYAVGLAALAVIAILEFGRDTPFIYFQF